MSDTTTPSTAGLKPGENPYSISNDDPRVADTVALLQSWGAPSDVVYHTFAGTPYPNNVTHFIRQGCEDTVTDSADVYGPNSGLIVQNPKTAYNEMKTRNMINAALATAEPSGAWDGR